MHDEEGLKKSCSKCKSLCMEYLRDLKSVLNVEYVQRT